jgi:hypothetical protein
MNDQHDEHTGVNNAMEKEGTFEWLLDFDQIKHCFGNM